MNADGHGSWPFQSTMGQARNISPANPHDPGRRDYYSHLTDEETEARRCVAAAQGHAAHKGWGRDLKLTELALFHIKQFIRENEDMNLAVESSWVSALNSFKSQFLYL